jgi:hypothetical protein
LVIGTNPALFVNYTAYPFCSNILTGATYPCIEDGKVWGQSENVMETKLGGEDARSFYLAYDLLDDDYHIQTSSSRPLQAKMLVSGGGLDPTFEQILSTFRFTAP